VNHSQRLVVLMARWPAPGRCKSRLAADLGAVRAAAVQQRLLRHSVTVLEQVSGSLACQTRLALAGAGPRAGRRLASGVSLVLQGGGGLGTRMQRQFAAGFAQRCRQVVLIGSDLPALDSVDLADAFAALEQAPLVLGPANDGGYWLVGLSQPSPSLFAGIPWGSERVLAHTLTRARGLQLPWLLLRQQADLDRLADLDPWR